MGMLQFYNILAIKLIVLIVQTPFLLHPFAVTVVVGILVGLAVGTQVLLSRSDAQRGE